MQTYTFRIPKNSQPIQLQLEPETTMGQIREILAGQLNCCADTIRILFFASTLDDSKKISDLNVQANNPFAVIIKPNKPRQPQQQCIQKPQSPISLISLKPDQPPLPKQDRIVLPKRCGLSNPLEDPPTFDIVVKDLIEMGFSQEDAEKAYRAAFYNKTRAVEYLVSGNIPDALTNKDEDIKQELSKLAKSSSRDESNSSSSSNSHTSHLPELKSFKPEEREAILRFVNDLKYDLAQVIQVYVACNRDEITTSSCLKTLK